MGYLPGIMEFAPPLCRLAGLCAQVGVSWSLHYLESMECWRVDILSAAREENYVGEECSRITDAMACAERHLGKLLRKNEAFLNGQPRDSVE